MIRRTCQQKKMMSSNTNKINKMEKLQQNASLCPKDVKQMPSTVERRDGKNRRESSNFNRNNLIPSILYCFNGVQKYKETALVPIESWVAKHRVRQIKLKPTRRKMTRKLNKADTPAGATRENISREACEGVRGRINGSLHGVLDHYRNVRKRIDN